MLYKTLQIPFYRSRYYSAAKQKTSLNKSAIDLQNKSDQQWAASEEGSSRMMKHINKGWSVTHLLPVDMSDYMNQRFKIKNSHSVMSQQNSESETRIMSSLLTFPLSLSLGINQVFGVIPRPNTKAQIHVIKTDDNSKLYDLKVLVVGARSEATLPKMWWRECMICCPSLRNLDVHFMGPHLSLLKKSSSTTTSDISHDNDQKAFAAGGRAIDSEPFTLIWNNLIETTLSFTTSMRSENEKSIHHNHFSIANNKNNERKLTVSNLLNGNCKLHEYSGNNTNRGIDIVKNLLQQYDMFVLFNPGYGSSALEESWKDSIQLLLNSGKPVLCTAHSKFDMERDLKVLKSYIESSSEKSQHQQLNYHTNSVTDASNKTDESWLPPLEFDTSIVYDDDDDDTYSVSSNDNRANVRWYLKPDLNSFHSSKQTFDIKESTEAQIVTTNQYIYCFHLQQ